MNLSAKRPSAARLRVVCALAALVALAALAASDRSRAADRHPDFGEPIVAYSEFGDSASVPRLAKAPDGSLLLSWLAERPGGGHALRLSRFVTGLHRPVPQWSAPVTIAEGDSFFANWADFPAVCALGGRTLAAAWMWKTGADTYAYETRIAFSRDDGATWSEPLRVHDDVLGTEHGFVSLLRVDGSHVRVLWLDGHNFKGGVEEGMADMTLHSRVIRDDGSLGREEELDSRACDCCQTAMIATRRGVLVAYRDRDAHEIRDISLLRLEHGKWLGPFPANADRWKIPGCPVNGPALSAHESRVALAWYTEAREVPSVWVAFSNDQGRRFGRAIRVDEGAAMGRVDVEMLEDGSAAVCWVEGEKAKARVLARRIAPDGKKGPLFAVADVSGARGSGFPQMVTTDAGFMFAWTEPTKPSKIRLGSTRVREPKYRRPPWKVTKDPR